MFHSGVANTQLGQAELQLFSILLKRNIHTSPWQSGARAQGTSLTAHVRLCLCKEKNPRFCESVFLTWGVRWSTLWHTCHRAGCRNAVPHQAAPLMFYRYRGKRQLIVLKTSEQILGRRHSQLVNIANYLQLRKNVS